MTKEATSALRILRDLIAGNKEEAWIVGIGRFPDLDEGASEAYEKILEESFLEAIGEIGHWLEERHQLLSRDLEVPWTPFKVSAWKVSDGIVAVAFLYRDDWDTPLTLQVGTCEKESLKGEMDPWNWVRQEVGEN